jgi:hypothetical protein
VEWECVGAVLCGGEHDAARDGGYDEYIEYVDGAEDDES